MIECMKNSRIEVVESTNINSTKTNWKVLSAIIGIVVLTIGVIAGIILVKQQQNISEKAATSCLEQCPGSDGVLRNCHPPNADGSSVDSICNLKGKISFCGVRNFCCNGSVWTTDLTSCAVATTTTTSTTTATATATSTATSSAKTTPTAKSSATATAVPIPVTGIEWPTMLGTGFGVTMIVVSMFLAL